MHDDITTILDLTPEAYREYKHRNGPHFNHALCDFAVSRMTDDDGKPIKALTRQEVEHLLKEAKIEVKHLEGYDHVFAANMCLADYLGESVPDMEHLAKYIKDVIDDPDGYTGIVFCRWLADCVAKHVEVPWEDCL